jgi:formamidopyrimidine-DNA glycosylase
MPEMPEVETIARKLRRVLVGKCVADVHLSGLPLRKPIAETFASRLRGRVIRKIHRRGKYIILELEQGAFWLIHLGMTGRVLCSTAPVRPGKHTHAVVRFTDRTELQYSDHRRFGLLAAYEVSRLNLIPELHALGKDPLGRSFAAAWLRPRLQASRAEIKSFLLDQHNVAGLGNIYVCEALHQARILPTRRCNTLSPAEAGRLVRAVRGVLRGAIRNRGTSFSDFMDSDGEPGENQRFLAVFQREGEKCRRCRSQIRRVRQGNRSTFYCPRCQV